MSDGRLASASRRVGNEITFGDHQEGGAITLALNEATTLRLAELVRDFERRSGPVRWSQHDLDNTVVRLDLRPAISAAAFVEAATRRELRKAEIAGLCSVPSIRRFFDQWIVEEDEHACVFTYLSRGMGVHWGGENLRTSERVRARLAPLGLQFSRLLPNSAALFLGVGAAAEYVTTTLYRRMASMSDTPELRLVLSRIAAQESRHFRFFLGSAVAMSRHAWDFGLVRSLLIYGWNPVGFDRLGADDWLETFRPLLLDGQTRSELARMDDQLDAIPVFSGLGLMSRFLDSDPVRSL